MWTLNSISLSGGLVILSWFFLSYLLCIIPTLIVTLYALYIKTHYQQQYHVRKALHDYIMIHQISGPRGLQVIICMIIFY